MDANLGYLNMLFDNKCWPAYQTQFGFVPCYVNYKYAAKGIPIACETDIYSALNDYIITCATKMPATLLDINYIIPRDMWLKRRYPHHGGVTFKHNGKVLFAAMKLLGIDDVAFNQPTGMLYRNENPF